MQLNFKTYCDKNNLQSVRDFVRTTLSQKGISDQDSYLTVLAIDEICANLMIHSNCCDNDKQINLNLNFLEDQLQITITDYGISFNYDNHVDSVVEDLIADKKKGGLGLLLVKRIMDSVSYESFNGYNNWVLLKKVNIA
ncbi:MAG: ATP-binding protein [Opitutaceae bacterium]|nr:ATP-binding protein [Cytophagales bacterium]